jgi:hypothetical protein
MKVSDKDQCAQPMRAKYWKELSIEEKLERTREQAQNLKAAVRSLTDMVNGLSNHEHGADGRPMVKMENHRWPALHAERENEYF